MRLCKPWGVKRLALIPLGVLLGLLVLEAGLRVGAWFVRVTGREVPASWVTGNVRVLCLGDSNTYGLWVERHEAYPQQLEALWNESVDSPKLEVLNLGFPGTNSSRLVRDLPRLLKTFRPDIVILMAGVNDFWTVPFPLENSPASAASRGFLERHSLVHRLYHLVRRGLDARELEIIMDPNAREGHSGANHKARFGDEEFEMGFLKATPGLHGDREALRENLEALVAQAEAFGTRLVLMSYPTSYSFYHLANPVIAEVAKDTNTEWIELAPHFPSICSRQDCPDLFFPDRHPKATGYRIVAETIFGHLSATAK
jgi:lysophospholipase L1-like esterase